MVELLRWHSSIASTASAKISPSRLLSKVRVYMIVWKQFPSGASLFHYQFLPFMSSVSSLFSHKQPQADSAVHLDHVIPAWGMEGYLYVGTGITSSQQ